MNTYNMIATVSGQPFIDLPKDLYIPPDALRVLLEMFEGPLDLLLYLIKRDSINILDIPLARVTQQYVEYIDMMQRLKLELAADYLEMAALLIEIKSRLLLPRIKTEDEEEVDPRIELVEKLKNYQFCKQGSEVLTAIPVAGIDYFICNGIHAVVPAKKPQIYSRDVINDTLLDMEKSQQLRISHRISREVLSVRERMAHIVALLDGDIFVQMHVFFSRKEGRAGVVVTFLAILEMAKEGKIEIMQQVRNSCDVQVRLSIC